jgi:hypothetical protein
MINFNVFGKRTGYEATKVDEIRMFLADRGLYTGARVCDGFVTASDLAALKDWQARYMGPELTFLEVDGIYGPKTEWSMRNPTQRLRLHKSNNRIPDGLHGYRLEMLQSFEAEYMGGKNKEIKRSGWAANRGERIDIYNSKVGEPKTVRGHAWCANLVMWVWNNVFPDDHAEHLPPHVTSMDEEHSIWSVRKMVARAKDRGIWRDNDRRYYPIPGDVQCMLYRDDDGDLTGHGHVSVIARVPRPPAVRSEMPGSLNVNTYGGNESDALRYGIRDVFKAVTAGFINPYPRDEQSFPGLEYGVVTRESLDGSSTR